MHTLSYHRSLVKKYRGNWKQFFKDRILQGSVGPHEKDQNAHLRGVWLFDFFKNIEDIGVYKDFLRTAYLCIAEAIPDDRMAQVWHDKGPDFCLLEGLLQCVRQLHRQLMLFPPAQNITEFHRISTALLALTNAVYAYIADQAPKPEHDKRAWRVYLDLLVFLKMFRLFGIHIE